MSKYNLIIHCKDTIIITIGGFICKLKSKNYNHFSCCGGFAIRRNRIRRNRIRRNRIRRNRIHYNRIRHNRIRHNR